jgi:DNA-directed RNA polymerase specialized sigma24 family protein
MGDQALVAALRCQDEGALREFFLRFRPGLCLAAGRLGVAAGERETVVDDCLADVAVHLITSDGSCPRSLPAYLARSLRNRVLNRARARARAERRLELEPAAADEALAAGCSEYALRVSDGRPEAISLSPALQRLAAVLEASLSEADRLLAVWMSHLVPPQEIAAWLGIAPKAAAKRVERLRERLQRTALEYIEGAGGEERRELLVFLGRATLAPGSAAWLARVRGDVEEPVP